VEVAMDLKGPEIAPPPPNKNAYESIKQ